MTTATPTAADIFADARLMHSEALERLLADDIRDAAEKAWCATKRATEALLLAQTGEIPPTTSRVSSGIRGMGRSSEEWRWLQERFASNVRYLHHDCFYNGHCEPREDVEQRIRETSDYIDSAENLANL